MLNIFSPVITLVLYAYQLRSEESIDANLVFTSLAMIGMVTNPANSLLILVPQVASFIARFDRIQKYLTSPDREDKRKILDKQYQNGANQYVNGNGNNSTPRGQYIALAATAESNVDTGIAISISDTTIRPAPTADPVLKNVNAKIKKGSLVVCVGAVGTGKTTLAKALLGDLPSDTGSIGIAFNSIAYCSQSAWLINGKIQDIIMGPPGVDDNKDLSWYRRVLRVCDLEADLLQLPDGDQTVVGSRGVTLSGGQKQRVVSRIIHEKKSSSDNAVLVLGRH
jgi:ATP-binding cassette, subfamily C (CFTR/MRP), member 1